MKTAIFTSLLFLVVHAHAQQTVQINQSQNANATATPPAAPPVHEAPEGKGTADMTGAITPADKVADPKKAEKALAPIEKDLKKEEARQVEIKTEEKTVTTTREQKSHFGIHAALGVPHPLTAGIDFLSPSRTFGFSILGGSYKATISDYDVNLNNVEAQFRYHPWSSAFYLGLGAGNHSVKAEKTEVISGQSVYAQAEVKATYLTPQFGWIAMWDSGFTLGFQLGVLLPSGATTDFTTNATGAALSSPEYAQLEKDVKDKGDQYGKMTLPYVTLLRLGWMF